MKIKIIEALTLKSLEKSVNDFLSSDGIKVIQVQYQLSTGGRSVMVVYEGNLRTPHAMEE